MSIFPEADNDNRRKKTNFEPSDQPGDGGLGVIFEASGYRKLKSEIWHGSTLFTSVSYLLSTRRHNQASSIIQTLGAGSQPTVQNALVNSVPDSYVMQAGVAIPAKSVGENIKFLHQFSWNPTIWMQGVRQTNIFTGHGGFRQPGFTFAIDPGFSFVRGRNIVTVNVPITFLRQVEPDLSQLLGSGFRTGATVAPVSLAIRYTRIY